MSGLPAPLPEALRAPPQRVPVPRTRRWRGMVLGFVGGAVLAYGGLTAFSTLLPAAKAMLAGASLAEKVAFVLLLPLPYWLMVLLHEAGHLLAGRWVGFAPIGLIAGPLRLDRRDGRWLLSRNRVRTPGGLALMRPGPRARERGPWMVYLSGGVVANFVTGALALAVLPALHGVAAGLVGVFALLSLVLGLVNLLPFMTEGMRTDGANLLMLLRREPDAQSLLLESALTAEAISGVRPAAWSGELVDAIAASAASPAAQLRASLYAALHAQDRGDPAQALAQFTRMAERLHADRLASVPPTLQAHYLAPIAAFLATQGEPDAAERWLDAAGRMLFDAWEADAARALIAHARGHAADAQQLAQKVLAQLPQAVDAGSAVAMRERMAPLLS